jgi:hypothetical protein
MKNLFVVDFGVTLWLGSWGITGCGAELLGLPLRWVLGNLIERGILVIDLTIVSIKVAMELDTYRPAAIKAYKRAKARLYTDEEKKEIRRLYLDVMRDFARVGNGMRERGEAP